ncbi:GlxA family transcriptional regulator [Ruegeria sp. 2205SS24-7]|uniref:GlxA family transcriptional regulator n=1 Tax=Ruegeria discodermiae TaxID=3064389 RepID=UPI00274244B4|nr:GlxA family transcriptional regulator [Ruegeria sp. 2205SS24-7]MDP5220989.1 GlxA family transcriptional regulator [Ruegeria sp. 2205SS24-7]
MTNSSRSIHIRIIVTPSFNMAATMGFVDPFRAANYLEGMTNYSWDLVSEAGGVCVASNGVSIETSSLREAPTKPVDFLIVSSSWTPEAHGSSDIQALLRQASRQNTTIGGIDTGAFILAAAGLLDNRRATVHYEHIDAFRELYPEVECTEALFEFDEDRITCCGGSASFDFALQILRGIHGNAVANAAARYVFHPRMRERGMPQNPQSVEPLGAKVPGKVKKAIKAMEDNLEDPLPIKGICEVAQISQRQLSRLFAQYLRKTPVLYYRDIRLDRARGLVTQTTLPMSEIAYACGFSSQVHFSRAYRERFGLPPIKDRIEGRIPFEFRAWPMHRKRNNND